MRAITLFAVRAGLMLSVAARLPAQAHEEHAEHAEQLGHVRFATSCSPEAERRFEQGVALLHSFWYERASDTFQAVVAADSACAMGYWGQAMSLFHPLWIPPAVDPAAGLAAAERGLTLARTARERAYGSAVRSYYAAYSTTDHKTRLGAYALAMQGVSQRYPDDREAKIFYALALIALGLANPTDTTFAYQRQADAILEPLFKLEPEHPGLAHYLIHGNDAPQLARHGLYAARHYAAIAPDVPHAQHMPSHIFTRLGLWDDDIASNTRSAAAGRKFEEERHLNALWDQTGHAWDYLVYADLQQGRDAAAKQVVDEAVGVTASYPPGSLVNAYALAAIPARYALERGRWSDAARLAVRPAPEWPATEALTHFARAIGTARAGDTALARAEIAALSRIESELSALRGGQVYDWTSQVKIQRLAASAWLERAAGNRAEAVRQATAAADLEDRTLKHPITPGAVLPARELLGDLLLELGRPEEAATAYAASLVNQPGRARSVFGAARAAELRGDLGTARARYQEFLTLMQQGDGDRPEVAIARGALSRR